MQNGLPFSSDITRQTDQSQYQTFGPSGVAPHPHDKTSAAIPSLIPGLEQASSQGKMQNQEYKGSSPKPGHLNQEEGYANAAGGSKQHHEKNEQAKSPSIAPRPASAKASSKPEPPLPNVMKLSLERMEKAQKEVLQARLELFSLGFAREEDIVEQIKPSSNKVSKIIILCLSAW